MNVSSLQLFKKNGPDYTSTYQDVVFDGTILTDLKLPFKRSLVRNIADIENIKQFASDNGLTYDSEMVSFSYTNSTQNVPAWCRSNRYGVQVDQVTGEYRGRLCSFSSWISIAPNESDKSIRTRSVIRVKLGKVFPQVVLDSNKNDGNRGALVSSMAAGLDVSQLTRLEGDFNDYFDFYSPKGIAANTLTLLAPNFMQILIDSSVPFDVEFFGGEMIITTDKPIYTTWVMSDAIRALDAQLPYLDRLESSWNYTPLVAPFDVLRVAANDVPVVKIGKHRYGPTGSVVIAILITIALLITWTAVYLAAGVLGL